MGIIESIIYTVYVKILLISQYTLNAATNSITNIDFTKPGTGSRNRWGLTSLIFGPLLNYLMAKGLTPFWIIVIIIIAIGIIAIVYFAIKYRKNPITILITYLTSPPVLIGLVVSIAFCLWSQNVMNTTGIPLPTKDK